MRGTMILHMIGACVLCFGLHRGDAAESCAVAQGSDQILGYRWGTQVSVMQEPLGLELAADQGSRTQYSSRLTFVGEANVDACDFEFLNGRFAGVIITTKDSAASHAVLRYLRSLYGEGKREAPDRYGGVGYQWFSKASHVSYDESADGDAYVYWYSVQADEARKDSGPKVK